MHASPCISLKDYNNKKTTKRTPTNTDRKHVEIKARQVKENKVFKCCIKRDEYMDIKTDLTKTKSLMQNYTFPKLVASQQYSTLQCQSEAWIRRRASLAQSITWLYVKAMQNITAGIHTMFTKENESRILHHCQIKLNIMKDFFFSIPKS